MPDNEQRLADIQATLARLDERTRTMDDRLFGVGGAIHDMDERIQKLERWRWITTGVGAAAGLGAGELVRYLGG